jgi:hypothetical protein
MASVGSDDKGGYLNVACYRGGLPTVARASGASGGFSDGNGNNDAGPAERRAGIDKPAVNRTAEMKLPAGL